MLRRLAVERDGRRHGLALLDAEDGQRILVAPRGVDLLARESLPEPALFDVAQVFHDPERAQTGGGHDPAGVRQRQVGHLPLDDRPVPVEVAGQQLALVRLSTERR
jgi:hypothetical protein